MRFDFDIFCKTVLPFLLILFGAWLNRFIERRVKLVAYFVHASAITTKNQPVITVNSHSIVVLNSGKLTANNVRIVHNILPDYSVYPSTQYVENTLLDNKKEIVILKLLPKEQVTISYLYFPPLLYNQIHSGVKSDEVFAKEISVIPSPQYNKWIINLLRVCIFIGIASMLYWIYMFIISVFFQVN